MISPEGSPWSKTAEFLKRFGVRVDHNNKGSDTFNQLECESSGDLLVLRKRIEGAAARVELSFAGQVDQQIVTASVVLEAEKEDELRELFRREAYLVYSPTGRINLGQIMRAILTTNTLVLVPKSNAQRRTWFSKVTFTPRTGALRPTEKQSMYLGQLEHDLSYRDLRFTR